MKFFVFVLFVKATFYFIFIGFNLYSAHDNYVGSSDDVRSCYSRQVGQLYWVSVKSLFSIARGHIHAKVNNLEMISRKSPTMRTKDPGWKGRGLVLLHLERFILF